MSIPVEKIKEIIGWLEGEASYKEYQLFGLINKRLDKVYRAKAEAYRECMEYLQKVVNEVEANHTGNPPEPERDDKRKQG